MSPVPSALTTAMLPKPDAVAPDKQDELVLGHDSVSRRRRARAAVPASTTAEAGTMTDEPTAKRCCARCSPRRTTSPPGRQCQSTPFPEPALTTRTEDAASPGRRPAMAVRDRPSCRSAMVRTQLGPRSGSASPRSESGSSVEHGEDVVDGHVDHRGPRLRGRRPDVRQHHETGDVRQRREVRTRSGSSSKTSRPAECRRPDRSAATSASWSTTGPRAVLTNVAVGFMAASSDRR